MLPTLAQPLASIAGGAALPAAAGAANAAAPRSAARSGAAGRAPAAGGAADSLAAAANGGVPPGAAPSTAPRARTGGAGYAAGPPAASSAGKKGGTAAPAPAGSKAAATTAKASGPLSFLQDGTLSVEEKLMRLLAYLSDKWDRDLEKKMKEIGAGQQKTAGAPAAPPSKKGGGVLGSIGAIVKTASSFFPAVGVAMEALKNPTVRAALSKVGGPVLAAAATALGHPALAPLLLRYGPTLVDVAAGVATSLDGGGASAGGAPASGTASSSGSSPSATGMNDSELRLKLMEIERIQNLQKEMFSLVSNILRAGHETRMNVIQNVR